MNYKELIERLRGFEIDHSPDGLPESVPGANNGADMNESLQQAIDLVAKHGSVRAASKASGIAKSTLQGRYNKAKKAQNSPEETNVLQRKKYEFTGETKEFCGGTLKQIRALVTIAGVVTAGDCGGWIESEKNLAQVYGNAWVSGNARVSGNNALFWASKVGSENGTLTVFNSKDGTLTVTRGCFIGSCDEFLEKSKRVHDEKTHREYSLLIEVAKSRIECKAKEVMEEA